MIDYTDAKCYNIYVLIYNWVRESDIILWINTFFMRNYEKYGTRDRMQVCNLSFLCSNKERRFNL